MSTIFEYPTTTPTATLTLPNPTLGDNEQINVKLLQKRTMSKRIVTHKRTPVNYRLLLTWDILKENDKDNLKTFLDSSNRNEIKLTLHNGDVWHGKILNVPISLVNNNTEQWATTLEFVGEKQ